MAYYRLINTLTQEKIKINVGEFYSRGTIELGTGGRLGNFLPYPDWDTNSSVITPVIRSRGDSFTDVKPFEYWEQYGSDEIAFESDIRYTLHITPYTTSGTVNKYVVEDDSTIPVNWNLRYLKVEIWTGGRRAVDLGYMAEKDYEFIPISVISGTVRCNASIMFDIDTKSFAWSGINVGKFAFAIKNTNKTDQVPVIMMENPAVDTVKRGNMQDYRKYDIVRNEETNIIIQTPPPWKYVPSGVILQGYTTAMNLVRGYGVSYNENDQMIIAPDATNIQNRLLYYLLYNKEWTPYDSSDDNPSGGGSDSDSGDDSEGG